MAAEGQYFGGNVALLGKLGVGTLNPTEKIDVDGNVSLTDNSKIKLGTSDDFQLYHDGSQSRITDIGTGRLTIETNGDSIRLTKGTSENMAIFTPDGSVDLYYNNVKKV